EGDNEQQDQGGQERPDSTTGDGVEDCDDDFGNGQDRNGSERIGGVNAVPTTPSRLRRSGHRLFLCLPQGPGIHVGLSVFKSSLNRMRLSGGGFGRRLFGPLPPGSRFFLAIGHPLAAVQPTDLGVKMQVAILPTCLRSSVKVAPSCATLAPSSSRIPRWRRPKRPGLRPGSNAGSAP